jgi:hypothetical protein
MAPKARPPRKWKRTYRWSCIRYGHIATKRCWAINCSAAKLVFLLVRSIYAMCYFFKSKHRNSWIKWQAHLIWEMSVCPLFWVIPTKILLCCFLFYNRTYVVAFSKSIQCSVVLLRLPRLAEIDRWLCRDAMASTRRDPHAHCSVTLIRCI